MAAARELRLGGTLLLALLCALWWAPAAHGHPCNLDTLERTGFGTNRSAFTRGDGGPVGVYINGTGRRQSDGSTMCDQSDGDCFCQPGTECFCEMQHGDCFCGQASKCNCNQRTGNCFCNQTDNCHCRMTGISTVCHCQDSCSCWCGDLFAACLGGNAEIMTCIDISDPYSGVCNCENADRCLFNSFGFGNNLNNATYGHGMNPQGQILRANATTATTTTKSDSSGLSVSRKLLSLALAVSLVRLFC